MRFAISLGMAQAGIHWQPQTHATARMNKTVRGPLVANARALQKTREQLLGKLDIAHAYKELPTNPCAIVTLARQLGVNFYRHGFQAHALGPMDKMIQATLAGAQQPN